MRVDAEDENEAENEEENEVELNTEDSAEGNEEGGGKEGGEEGGEGGESEEGGGEELPRKNAVNRRRGGNITKSIIRLVVIVSHRQKTNALNRIAEFINI